MDPVEEELLVAAEVAVQDAKRRYIARWIDWMNERIQSFFSFNPILLPSESIQLNINYNSSDSGGHLFVKQMRKKHESRKLQSMENFHYFKKLHEKIKENI